MSVYYVGEVFRKFEEGESFEGILVGLCERVDRYRGVVDLFC